MPRPHPSEFRQRAVELARLREKPTAQIAKDLGISDSCLRSWMRQADINDGRRDGTTTNDQAELAEPADTQAARGRKRRAKTDRTANGGFETGTLAGWKPARC
jgi:transposase-like protein